MPRSSEEVGAAWGKLIGLAVNACKSCHESKCRCDDHAAKPFIPSKPSTETDPNSEIPSLTLTPGLRCEPAWTKRKGEVLVNYDQTGQNDFDFAPMYFLDAGESLSTNSKVGTPNPMQMNGPGNVSVTMDPNSERGLYIGHVHTPNGVQRPVLIYIDDVI